MLVEERHKHIRSKYFGIGSVQPKDQPGVCGESHWEGGLRLVSAEGLGRRPCEAERMVRVMLLGNGAL